MSNSFHFSGKCPKCQQPSKLVISGWKELSYKFILQDDLITEPSHTISLSVYCESCDHYSAGITYYEYDGPDIGPLSHYADASGDVSKSLSALLKDINYDTRHLKKNLTLLDEAKCCIELGLLNAGVILCRKIIDCDTKKTWMVKFPTEKPPESLKVRINKLYSEKDEKDGKAKVYHRAHAIRIDGNSVVHGDEVISPKDAKEILSFTEWFCEFNHQQ
ncbi:TPA: DUF4145 domain-containing protein [Pluralibacter gergoviae]|uniref:DUF4145 domain-containing protein n=1 Tax=Pluralibacter gergoviae TaxID=61647 RepID=UPI0009BB36AA|nr:DUF4145 domain-containing protein [Pluralibacter gergoviae]MBL3695340.1 DUF4145 domain-containing protein [Pluralibacter gergoviae]HDS1150278.1 DUF4145 domain-containing protein [Pluralibacter gergoviae]